jgi:hypothetical protein
MDEDAKRFLSGEGVPEPEPDALYILVQSRSGALLEDLAPLFSGLTSAYRKLLTLSVDSNYRIWLARYVESGQRRHGFSRSLNRRFEQLVLPSRVHDQLFAAELDTYVRETLPPDYEVPAQVRSHEEKGVRPYQPIRLEARRARFSSPGFIELLGDRLTLATLLSFLAGLLQLRRLERQDRDKRVLAVRAEQRENIALLDKLGYSHDEISAVSEYLSGDMSSILSHLHANHLILAPGDSLELLGLGSDDSENR